MINIISNGNTGVSIMYNDYGVDFNEKQLSDKYLTAGALLEGFNKDKWRHTPTHHPDNYYHRPVIKNKYLFLLIFYSKNS